MTAVNCFTKDKKGALRSLFYLMIGVSTIFL